jgi:hypothetical protein
MSQIQTSSRLLGLSGITSAKSYLEIVLSSFFSKFSIIFIETAVTVLEAPPEAAPTAVLMII